MTRTTRIFRTTALVAVTLCGVALSACSRAQAKARVDGPVLDMPAPPPRVVEVSDPEIPRIVSVPEEPARPEPTRPRPTPPPPRESRPADAARTEPPKPDVPADAGRTAEDGTRLPAAPLQTAPTQAEVEMERRVRVLLVRASTDLGHVNYQGLNTDGRTQYDTAKRFISQSEEAIRARNFVFAANLADKASGLAAQLAGR